MHKSNESAQAIGPQESRVNIRIGNVFLQNTQSLFVNENKKPIKPSPGCFLYLLLFPDISVAWNFPLSFWKLLNVPSQGNEEPGSLEI